MWAVFSEKVREQKWTGHIYGQFGSVGFLNGLEAMGCPVRIWPNAESGQSGWTTIVALSHGTNYYRLRAAGFQCHLWVSWLGSSARRVHSSSPKWICLLLLTASFALCRCGPGSVRWSIGNSGGICFKLWAWFWLLPLMNAFATPINPWLKLRVSQEPNLFVANSSSQVKLNSKFHVICLVSCEGFCAES